MDVMPEASLRSKLVWAAAGLMGLLLLLLLVLLLVVGPYGLRALAPTAAASGPPEADPLIGRWACVKSVGLLGEARLELRLGFGADRSLSVDVATTNGLGTSPPGCAAGRGTWERRGTHQLLLSV